MLRLIYGRIIRLCLDSGNLFGFDLGRSSTHNCNFIDDQRRKEKKTYQDKNRTQLIADHLCRNSALPHVIYNQSPWDTIIPMVDPICFNSHISVAGNIRPNEKMTADKNCKVADTLTYSPLPGLNSVHLVCRWKMVQAERLWKRVTCKICRQEIFVCCIVNIWSML